MDRLNIKKWAEEKHEQQISTVKEYINKGIDKTTAVNMVLQSSTLGEGYKAQLRREFGLSLFV